MDVGPPLVAHREPALAGQPRQRPAQAEDALERGEAHLDLLADRRSPVRPLGCEQHAGLGQLLLERAASVGQVPEEPPRGAALPQPLWYGAVVMTVWRIKPLTPVLPEEKRQSRR